MAEPCGDPPQCPAGPESPEKSQIPPNSPQIRPRGRPAARTRLRNRRYAALRELLREGDYFSEQQMRLRAPGLFHRYIGRFQEPQKPPNRPQILGDPKTLPGEPQKAPNCPQILGDPKTLPGEPQKAPGPPQGLRELLLSALELPAAEDDEDDEDEEEEDEDDDEGDEGRVPDAAERELLRREFTSRMFQRFLEGRDGAFDYSQVDENPELDNLDIVSQDLEDQYFDQEEPGPAPQLL